MIEKLLNQALTRLSWRLFLAAAIIILPVAVSTTWLAAAIQQALEPANFLRTMVRLLLVGMVTAVVAIYALLYPLERWVIRDRAARVRGWVVTRILLYIAAGFPAGLLLVIGMRLGTARRSPIVESSYVVIVVTNVGIIGLVYSFLEGMAEAVRRREAQLQHQIKQLRIEIDEATKERQVKEITESDYFQDLVEKTQQMRARYPRKGRPP